MAAGSPIPFFNFQSMSGIGYFRKMEKTFADVI